MKNKEEILIVVDYQYDFVSGALPVSGAEAIAEAIQDEINNPKYKSIIYTMDTHTEEDYAISEEVKLFPNIHCEFNTPGWELFKIKPRNREINISINEGLFEEPKDFSINEEYVFMKNKFSIWEGNSQFKAWFENTFSKDVEITIVGVALDVCVFEAAKGFIENGYKNIQVKDNCTKAISIENKERVVKEFSNMEVFFNTSS